MAKTFEIGALIVDYSSADVGELPSPASSTWNGIIVHVRGDQWSQGGPVPYGAKLTATQVKAIGLGVEDMSDAEVEGFIIQANGPGDFVVDNLHVQTTASTKFEGAPSTTSSSAPMWKSTVRPLAALCRLCTSPSRAISNSNPMSPRS